MELVLKTVEDGKLVEQKKHVSNFNITNENDQSISFSVRLVDNKNLPPHVGFVNFKNVQSQALKDVVGLLYKVVGMLREDQFIRENNVSVLGEIKRLEIELADYQERVLNSENDVKNSRIQYDCVSNIPDVVEGIRQKLDKLRNEFEINKAELNRLKKEYEITKDDQLQDKYLEKVKQLRNMVKELNVLVDLVNDKYVKKLNAKVKLDRAEIDHEKLLIEQNMIVERLKLLRSKSDKITPNLIYTTKRLGLEEDYEL